jgi:hypothetical protein
MMRMTLKIYNYADKMPHLNYSNPMSMGGWQETEE